MVLLALSQSMTQNGPQGRLGGGASEGKGGRGDILVFCGKQAGRGAVRLSALHCI